MLINTFICTHTCKQTHTCEHLPTEPPTARWPKQVRCLSLLIFSCYVGSVFDSYARQHFCSCMRAKAYVCVCVSVSLTCFRCSCAKIGQTVGVSCSCCCFYCIYLVWALLLLMAFRVAHMGVWAFLTITLDAVLNC